MISGNGCSEALEHGKSSLAVAATLLEDGELLLPVLLVTTVASVVSSSSLLSSSIFLFLDFLLAMGEVSTAGGVFTLVSPLVLYRVLMYC